MSYVVIKYTDFDFKKPGIIPQERFEVLKEQWERNPQMDIRPAIHEHKKKANDALFGLGFVVVLLSVLGGVAACFPKTMIEGVFVIVGFAGLFAILGWAMTLINYYAFVIAINDYYADLKKYVLESSDYDEFVQSIEDAQYFNEPEVE